MTLATKDQFMPGGERRCPRGESGCWWVVSGDPQGDGHSCLCLAPLDFLRPDASPLSREQK
jgi:hypothetical protein